MSEPRMPLAVEPTPGRLCWLCKHIYFATADPGYSEYTPGSDFSLSCGKRYWDFDQFNEDLPIFRAHLMSAERCADFERRDDGQ